MKSKVMIHMWYFGSYLDVKVFATPAKRGFYKHTFPVSVHYFHINSYCFGKYFFDTLKMYFFLKPWEMVQ